MQECEIGEHEFGEPGGWYHPVGSASAYRNKACLRCGHVEIEGRGLFDTRAEDPDEETMALEEVEVHGGRLDAPGQTVAQALEELAV